jgi:hypothetical protein
MIESIYTSVLSKYLSKYMTSFVLVPGISLAVGHIFLLFIIGLFYVFGFYDQGDYFRWGPPIQIFSQVITKKSTFYTLWIVIFIHQLISNWVTETVFPWIINNIQNPSIRSVEYSRFICLVIVNANSLYNQVHWAFIVSGLTAQVSFLLALVIADLISLTYINLQHLNRKKSVSSPNQIRPRTNFDLAKRGQPRETRYDLSLRPNQLQSRSTGYEFAPETRELPQSDNI